MPTARTSKRMVKIDGRDFAPKSITWTDDLTDDYTITLNIRYQAGRYVARSFTVKARRGDGAVSADLLRDVSIADLVRRAVSDQAMFTRWEVEETPLIQPDIDWGPSDNNLGVLAVIYRLELALGGNPTTAVAEKMGLTRPTAGRWVMKAREKGYLGKTDERKARA